jgi:cytochrome b pre-mRNA-processing protein 3
MSLALPFRRANRRAAVLAAYAAIVERARHPIFFTDWGVPDTLDGRFEVLALHAMLVLHRLKADHAATAGFAQSLFDTMFADLDRAVREMGATDLGVGRYVKAMARSFYGRLAAYERGLSEGDDVLHAALSRNLYGTAEARPDQVAAVAKYLRGQSAALAAQPVTMLLDGRVPFAPLETD